jgi:predicted rRNA methylase YqxC with S4 and FtsJ domains
MRHTSLARLDLTDAELNAIHQSARDINALEGITGFLVFNGTHFAQIIEGVEDAIDELVERLRCDRRHSGFEMRDERYIETREFPGWAMELVRVESDFFEVHDGVTRQLPQSLPAPVQDRIRRMTELVRGSVDFRS